MLRGAQLPIVEGAERLGLKGAEPTPHHVIIKVVRCHAKSVGLLLTAVFCNQLAADELIQPAPLVAPVTRAHLHWPITVGGRLVGILETDHLVPPGIMATAA